MLNTIEYIIRDKKIQHITYKKSMDGYIYTCITGDGGERGWGNILIPIPILDSVD
jgi:hypothetical protein